MSIVLINDIECYVYDVWRLMLWKESEYDVKWAQSEYDVWRLNSEMGFSMWNHRMPSLFNS